MRRDEEAGQQTKGKKGEFRVGVKTGWNVMVRARKGKREGIFV